MCMKIGFFNKVLKCIKILSKKNLFLIILIFCTNLAYAIEQENDSDSALKYLDPSELRKINKDINDNKVSDNINDNLNSDNVSKEAQDFILEQEKSNQPAYEYESPSTDKAKQLYLEYQKRSDSSKDKRLQYNISN